MSDTERILITVRTYPTPSTGNRETVCTGGITADLEWRRLYPVPLRYLPAEQQFRTWDVVKVKVAPARSDRRVESRRPQLQSLVVESHLDSWQARHGWVQPTAVESLHELKEAGRSLGPVGVGQVLDLEVKDVDPEWDSKRRAKLEERTLFDEPQALHKIPYEFRLRWKDHDGTEHLSLVISWEMGQTWRSYRIRYTDPLERMRTKLLEDYFAGGREVSFFMGNHSRFRDTFMICGWFIPPTEDAASGLLFQ